MAWVDPETVMGYWVGSDAPTDPQTVLPPLIKGAETVIKFHFKDMDARLAATEPAEEELMDRLEFVLARMVIRAVRNPEGARAVQSGAGPFQETVTYGGDEPGSIWMLDREYDMLLPEGSRSKHSGKAFTIDTGAHAALGTNLHLDTCSVWFGGHCSCGAVLLGWSQ